MVIRLEMMYGAKCCLTNLQQVRLAKCRKNVYVTLDLCSCMEGWSYNDEGSGTQA